MVIWILSYHYECPVEDCGMSFMMVGDLTQEAARLDRIEHFLSTGHTMQPITVYRSAHNQNLTSKIVREFVRYIEVK